MSMWEDLFFLLHKQNAYYASYMVSPVAGWEYKAKNVVLCNLSTDGSYLINKHRSREVNLVSTMSQYDQVISICKHGDKPLGSTRAKKIYT